LSALTGMSAAMPGPVVIATSGKLANKSFFM
jgi:hypothetical protein